MTSTSEHSVTLRLGSGDVQRLSSVARHYEQVLGSIRHIVRIFLPTSARRKYAHVVAEDTAVSVRVEAIADCLKGKPNESICMSVHDAVLFWGRILSTLNTRRSRRKLSADDAAALEDLADRFAAKIVGAWEVNPDSVEESINTRRSRERLWMTEALGLPQDSRSAQVERT